MKILDWEEYGNNINRFAEEYTKESTKRKLKTHTSIVNTEWQAPPLRWKKINFDTAYWDEYYNVVAILRGEEVWAKEELDGDAECEEITAATLALKKAKERGLINVILEGDVVNVVFSIRDDSFCTNWQSQAVTDVCTNMLLVRIVGSYSASRNCNFAAHNTTKWARNSRCFGSIPSENIQKYILSNKDAALVCLFLGHLYFGLS